MTSPCDVIRFLFDSRKSSYIVLNLLLIMIIRIKKIFVFKKSSDNHPSLVRTGKFINHNCMPGVFLQFYSHKSRNVSVPRACKSLVRTGKFINHNCMPGVFLQFYSHKSRNVSVPRACKVYTYV